MEETEGFPSDILTRCFGYLPTPTKVHVASVVDSNWRDAVNLSEWYIEERHVKENTFAWKERVIECLTINTANFVETSLLAISANSKVRNMKLNFQLGAKLWQVVSQSTINNDLVTLNSIDFMPMENFQLPKLTSINVFAISKADYWNTLPSSLESLSLSHITNATAMTHLQRFTNLTDLSLASCDELTQSGFLAIAKVSAGLVAADFSNTTIDAYSLDVILQKATCLSRLSIKDCQKLKDRDDVAGRVKPANTTGGNPMANIFAELKAVTTKVQTHVPAAYRDPEAAEEVEETDKGGFLSIGVGKCLCQGKFITDLQVSGVGFLDDYGVRLILKGMRNLKVFRMTKNRDISDAGFDLDDTPLPPNLNTISVGNCVQLTDDTLRVFSTQSALQSLNISGCTSVTEEGVLAVVENCQNLKRLCAFMVSLQSNVGNGLSRPPATADRIITNRVLRALWRLPQFESLAIAWQPAITAEGFPDDTYDSLRSFQADFCDFDTATYTKVFSSFPHLTSLSLTALARPETGARPVESEHLSILSEKCTNPRYISLQTPNPRILTKMIADGRLHRLDIEYFGTKTKFPQNEWMELLQTANSMHTPVFLGKYAQKLVNAALG